MKVCTSAIIAAVIALFPVIASAQLDPGYSHLGIGGGVVFPAGNIGNSYKMGYELHGNNVSHLSEHIAIGAHLGLQYLSGDGQDGQAALFTIGPEYREDNWLLGLHVGYSTGHNLGSEVVLIPMVGIQIGGFQLDVRYQLLNDYTWLGVGFTFYFLKW